MASDKKAIFDQPGGLMRETQRLLGRNETRLMHIHIETGIGFYWLRKFANNVFLNPSVNRVQYLYEYLSARKLPVGARSAKQHS